MVHEYDVITSMIATHLVGLAGKEHRSIADTQSALLLLSFLVYFRDRPCLDGTTVSLGLAAADKFSGVGVGRLRGLMALKYGVIDIKYGADDSSGRALTSSGITSLEKSMAETEGAAAGVALASPSSEVFMRDGT